MIREYLRKTSGVMFIEEFEKAAEFREASEEKIVCSRIVFGERRGVSEFSERREFCEDVSVFVL